VRTAPNYFGIVADVAFLADMDVVLVAVFLFVQNHFAIAIYLLRPKMLLKKK